WVSVTPDRRGIVSTSGMSESSGAPLRGVSGGDSVRPPLAGGGNAAPRAPVWAGLEGAAPRPAPRARAATAAGGEGFGTPGPVPVMTRMPAGPLAPGPAPWVMGRGCGAAG